MSASQELGEMNTLLHQELQRSEDGRVAAVTMNESKCRHLGSLGWGHAIFLPSTDLVSCAVLEATVSRNAEALAQSLRERSTVVDELDQLCNVVQVVVTEVLGSGLSTSVPAIQFAMVSDMVQTLITDGVFHGASRC